MPEAETSNWPLIRRLLALSWRYRWGCIQVLALQITLLAFFMSGVSFSTLGIDELKFALGASPQPPRWPLHLARPDWPPLQLIALIGAAVIAVALLRCAIDY